LKTRTSTIIILLTLLLVCHGTHFIQAANQPQGQPTETPRRYGAVADREEYLPVPKSDFRMSVISDGTDEAIRSLLDKDCELAAASRPMAPRELREAQEKGMQIREAMLGFIGLAVATHTTNPIQHLTIDQLIDILSGTITTWDQVGGLSEPISVIALSKQAAGLRGYHVRPGPGASVQQVSAEMKPSLDKSNQLALVPLSGAKLEESIKLLALKVTEFSPAILPTKEHVDAGSYPIASPQYLYIDWNHAPEMAKAFFNYCAGQSRRKPRELTR
jgi:phosphate transport system substrate-binding protein